VLDLGPKQVARERAYVRLLEIQRRERQKDPDWQAIIDEYQTLVQDLPPDEDPMTLYEIRLAVCRARLEMLDLDTAIDELTRLLQETAADCGENARITRGVREQLGKAHYYATWVLKTNAASRPDTILLTSAFGLQNTRSPVAVEKRAKLAKLEAKKRAGGALTQLELFDYDQDKFYLTADEEA
jgi:hypothetical protein